MNWALTDQKKLVQKFRRVLAGFQSVENISQRSLDRLRPFLIERAAVIKLRFTSNMFVDARLPEFPDDGL
jgi:hypothetical protein